MQKLLLILCIAAICACSKPQEQEQITITRKPAQLELMWDQAYDLNSDAKNKTQIPPEVEANLLTLGPFHSEYNILFREDKATISFRVVFINEITSDQAKEVLPLIKQTLPRASYKVIFHGAETTKKTKFTLK